VSRGPADRYPHGVRACAVDAANPPARLDLSGADEWRVLLTWGGTPCSYFELPSPGATSDRGIVDAAIVRRADHMAALDQLVDRLRRRLGAPDDPPAARSCSVVVCTHRRPDYIAQVLEALGGLDPPADEIVVVDNAPGDRDCRAEAERAGARYVREDRPGLDRARNAGLRASSGELVAFTDDDCVPAVGWLAALAKLFGDPSVAAVTGPAFAHALDTPSQVRFEDQGGHRRGLRRQVLDWTVLTPIAATRAGAGLNMIFRRSLLEGLGDVFPPELDSGTPTESGGDMYALYKLLRAGYRIVYDPATYVLHQHRPDARSLHRAIRGYGIGVSAVLTKLLVEERELAGPTMWYWLWWLYMDALRRRLAGRADAIDVRIGWDYLAGGLIGPAAWRRSRSSFGRDGAGPPPSAPVQTQVVERLPSAGLGISVIVTATRPGAEARCLEAIRGQFEGNGALEMIVVGAGRRSPPLAIGETKPRYVQADPKLGLRNTAAREARGDLLLFLDAETVPAPDCMAVHLRHHAAADREPLVVGYSPPDPSGGGLAALWEARRRHDHFERKRMAAAMTFADVRSNNLSLTRSTFERLGGFDVDLEGLGREGWELGVRALQQGCEVAYEPAAVAVEVAALDVGEAIAAACREGHGDALLEARHPVVSPSLPDRGSASGRHRWQRRLFARLLGSPHATRAAKHVLAGLEGVRARRLWLRLFQLVRAAAYARGELAGGRWRRPAPPEPDSPLRIELDSDEAIPPPSVAPPMLEISLAGEVLGRLAPTGGQWHAYLADEAAWVAADRVHALPLERPPAREEMPQGGDLAGVAIVLGPARRPGDDRHIVELRVAGAPVDVVDGDSDRNWAALDAAIRSAAAEIVVVPLPGVAPTPASLAGIAPALSGDRVAVALGAGLPPGAPARPLFLGTRRLLRASHPPLGRPAEYLAVRRDLYVALGGFDVAAARFGAHGVVLDLVDRALDAGWVVAYRDVPGLDPTPPSRNGGRRAAWARHRARGGLMLWRARRIGGARGVLWLLRHGLLPLAVNVARALRGGERSAPLAAGAAAAFISGCLLAALDRPDRGPRTAARPSSDPKLPEPRAQ